MRIGVIGLGVVGGTTLEILRRFGYDCFGYDSNSKRTESANLQYADIFFICTPEQVVETVIEQLSVSPDSLIVIRSTVLPGTTEHLIEKYDRHICHVPEFLRETTALYDALRPDRIVIGECCQYHGYLLEGVFSRMCAPIIRVDTKTSEMVKLVSNTHLANLISFWNEIHLICEKVGVNSHLVGRVVSMDKRISDYGALQHGKRFSGRCLPKDLEQLLSLCRKIGYDAKLLKEIKKTNEGISQ